MFLSESKRLSKIKERLDGWQRIADALFAEYSKVDKTADIQALLELCGNVSVDNRTIPPKLQSTIKMLCATHGIKFDSIPSSLKDAYNYAHTMQCKCETDFEGVKDKYEALRVKLKRLKIGAVIVVALLITVKPILYFEANFYEERGEYKNAKVVYSILDDYKDSKEKVQNVSAIIDNEDSLTKDTVNDESEDTADSTAASDEQNSSESHMLMTLSEDNHRSWDAGDNEAFELFKDMSDGLSKESAEEKYGAFKRGRRTHYDNPDKYRGLAEYKCANLTEEGKPTDIDVVFLVRTSDSEEVFSRITWATDYNKLQSSAFEQTCYAVADTLGVKCHGYNYDFYKEDGRYYWQRYEAYFGDVTLTCYYGDGYQNWYLDKEDI